jgi:hypothetical protein
VGQQPEQLRRPDDVDHTTRPRVAGPHSKHHSLLRSRLGGSDQDRNTTSGQEHHIRKINFYGVPARAAVQLIMHADSRSGTVRRSISPATQRTMLSTNRGSAQHSKRDSKTKVTSLLARPNSPSDSHARRVQDANHEGPTARSRPRHNHRRSTGGLRRRSSEHPEPPRADRSVSPNGVADDHGGAAGATRCSVRNLADSAGRRSARPQPAFRDVRTRQAPMPPTSATRRLLARLVAAATGQDQCPSPPAARSLRTRTNRGGCRHRSRSYAVSTSSSTTAVGATRT